MFTGLVEAQSEINNWEANNGVIRFSILKPLYFDDIKNGDSICVNGVCLTVEKLTEQEIYFCLGIETINVLKKSLDCWKSRKVNLERSLKFGDRVHGHLVTGHVDDVGVVVESYSDRNCWILKIMTSNDIKNYFWKKGSICLQGVSLTINQVIDDVMSVCLIPETIEKTNLSQFKKDDLINIEIDYLAKAYIHFGEAKHE